MTERLAPGLLMDRLERLGVRFELREGAVFVDAPARVLTTEDREQLAEHKATIERLVRLTYGAPEWPAALPATGHRADELARTGPDCGGCRRYLGAGAWWCQTCTPDRWGDEPDTPPDSPAVPAAAAAD